MQNSAKQNWKNKKNCYRYHSSSQRSLSPFWFQLLTIFSSFIGRDFYHRQLLVFSIVKIKITIVAYCHTDSQLHKSCDSQTWYTFLSSNPYRFYTYTPDIPICHCVYEVHAWSLNVLTISFVFLWVRGPAIMKILSVSVGLPQTMSAVSLTLHNTLQQYVPRNTVAKFYPNCFFLLLWNYIIGLLPSCA